MGIVGGSGAARQVTRSDLLTRKHQGVLAVLVWLGNEFNWKRESLAD